MAQTEHLLDLSGQHCPEVVLATRRALKGLASGDRLRVISTDPLSVIDLPVLVHRTGHVLLEEKRESGAWLFLIARR